VWNQIYDPLNNWFFSTLFAALPTFVLLGAIGLLRVKAYWSALLGVASALIVALVAFGMPMELALAAGAAVAAA
jgi:lactate permease